MRLGATGQLPSRQDSGRMLKGVSQGILVKEFKENIHSTHCLSSWALVTFGAILITHEQFALALSICTHPYPTHENVSQGPFFLQDIFSMW